MFHIIVVFNSCGLECRKHRRKCLRPTPNAACDRCERLGKICLINDDEQDAEDPDMKNLQTQVQQLEMTIQQLDTQLQTMRYQRDRQQFQTLIQDPMIQNLVYNWTCEIKNGTFQIETGIQNIRDLLNIRNPSLTYLSPLSSNFSDFESDTLSNTTSSSDNTYLGESGFAIKFGQDKPIESLVSIIVKFFTLSIHTRTKHKPTNLLPSSLLLTPNSLINELLDVYFVCHNPYNPMLHEATYRERLKTINDPLDDLITLCICVNVCTKPCYHVKYAPREIRNMADFFYTRAKSVLMDQFDDVDKRLENVLAVPFLVKYCHMTLKFGECRHLVTIGYQLCLELRSLYLDQPPTPLSKCFNEEMHHMCGNPSDIFRNEYPNMTVTDIDRELYRRNVFFMATANRMLDFILNKQIGDNCFHCPFWGYISDESESTKKYVFVRNWMNRFYNHSFVQAFSVYIVEH